MIKRLILAAFLLLPVSSLQAEQGGIQDLDLRIPYDFQPPPERRPPPQFDRQAPPPPPPQEFEWMQDNPNAVTDECERLRQNFDELKGKPQRRHAAMQYYRRYCQQYFDQHQGY